MHDHHKSAIQQTKETLGVGHTQRNKDDTGVGRSRLQKVKDNVGIDRSGAQKAKDQAGMDRSALQKARDALWAYERTKWCANRISSWRMKM
jgi:hypothetical protein